MKKILLNPIIIFLTIILVTLVVLNEFSTKNNDSLIIKENHNVTYEFDQQSFINYGKGKQINKLLKDSFTEDELKLVSVSVTVPSTELKYNYNHKFETPISSLINLPINMYIYELAIKDPTVLEQVIIYDYKYYVEGSLKLAGTLAGEEFTVQELLSYSIIDGDIIATNMLVDTFITDYSELKNYFGEANYTDMTSTTANKMQALDYLYKNQDVFKTLIDDMIASTNKTKVPLLLPETVTVANITGDNDTFKQDMGIVFDTEYQDYLIYIAVNDIYDGNYRIAALSSDIYNIINN